MTAEILEKYIRENLSEKRYIHSMAVAREAERLAIKYGADPLKAYIVGIAHDLAKEIPEKELILMLQKYGREDLLEKYSYALLHGPAAAVILENEFSVSDDEILEAVCYHTTGKPDMKLLTKIIYISDFIEPNRVFVGVEPARIAAEKNLDEAIIISSGMVIIHTVRKGKTLHPDTIIARNYLLNHYKSIELDF